ncbi:MAG: hypothetical protein AAF984_07820 [Verrucomicrobiota bacterium]
MKSEVKLAIISVFGFALVQGIVTVAIIVSPGLRNLNVAQIRAEQNRDAIAEEKFRKVLTMTGTTPWQFTGSQHGYGKNLLFRKNGTGLVSGKYSFRWKLKESVIEVQKETMQRNGEVKLGKKVNISISNLKKHDLGPVSPNSDRRLKKYYISFDRFLPGVSSGNKPSNNRPVYSYTTQG